MSLARVFGCLALVLLAPVVPLDARDDRALELSIAVERGDLKAAQALIAAGADVNARRPGASPALLLAVRSGNADLVKLLLRAGADPQAGSSSGASALVEAIERRQPELARTLVEAGADVGLRHREHGTALDAAERSGELALAAFLLLVAGGATAGRADSAADCFSEDIERRIEGCTALIEGGDDRSTDLSLAYAMRALAYSLKGRYERVTEVPEILYGSDLKSNYQGQGLKLSKHFK